MASSVWPDSFHAGLTIHLPPRSILEPISVCVLRISVAGRDRKNEQRSKLSTPFPPTVERYAIHPRYNVIVSDPAHALIPLLLKVEFDFGDDVDVETFEQILEMDEGEEDGSHEFSRSIVFGFLEQAESTFKKMDTAL